MFSMTGYGRSEMLKDSFAITDNLGGVGDVRNIIAMLDLQEVKFDADG